jgi:hypothetical protein
MYPMKNLYKGLAFLLLFACIRTQAQEPPVREPDYNKPKLFAQLPQRISIPVTVLESLVQSEIGKTITIPFATNLPIQGIVSSTAYNDNQVKSVAIRVTSLQGACLSVSKIRREDGSSYFSGRIISLNHGDAYEMIFENGIYYFDKKGLYDLVSE